MKTILDNLFDGKPVQAGVPSIYHKPACVGEYLHRPVLRDQGILPGDTISKMVGPKLVTLSEFSFKTLKSRKYWQEHYKYLNKRYECGLEAGYLDTSFFIENIEHVKLDIQKRILDGRPPKRVPNHIYLKRAKPKGEFKP